MRTWWIAALSLVALLAVLALPGATRTALGVAHDDRVHYVAHLVGTQFFSLCPCTANFAQTQYVKGMYHARTPRQAQLLSLRPNQLIGRAVRRVVA